MNEKEKDFDVEQDDVLEDEISDNTDNEEKAVSEDAAEDAVAEAAEEKKDKKKKKEKKDKRDEQIAELNDKLLRNRAEFENFRKRTEREKAQMFEVGAGSIVEKILPVIDNFERGLAAVPEDESLKSFKDGFDMIYKQFATTLEEIGVKPIEAVNNQFDPEYHNAVMHIDDESFGENVVVEEFQKGYTYKDRVIRHSMVKVAN